MFVDHVDYFPDHEPSPSDFDEHHVAFIELLGCDVEVTGYFVHADPSVGAPSAWRIERAVVHSADREIDKQDVTLLLDADEDALRRAENALNIARAGGWS
jgi:hypothetical protein